MKDRESRTPSPKKRRSISPKKNRDNPLPVTSASTSSAQAPPIKPTTVIHDHRNSALQIAQPRSHYINGGSHWSNLPFSTSKVATENSTLDVYAPSYVPLWLRAVNESIALPRLSPLLETINFSEYISSFAGRQYLHPLTYIELPPIHNVVPFHSVSPELLTPETYSAYFREALQNEVSSEVAELRSCSMFAAAFEPEDHSRHLYRVKVAGIRESSPRIDIGDIVLVRPLFHRSDVPELTMAWYAPGGGREHGLCAPAFGGLEFVAVVWGISRPKEMVVLRIDGLTALSCNIIFAVQQHRITPLARAITATADSLRTYQASSPSDWLRGILFPTPSDGVMQITLPKGTFPDTKWFDIQLNYEQQKAIDAVLNASYGNVPYLISGPPGTGKTKTIVETILQLLQMGQQPSKGQVGARAAPHILVCAPSDSAADTLASRLATRLTPAELFRLNGWSRSFPEVPGLLLPYSFVEKDLFSLPRFETLMSYKAVVTTCRDADMLVQARLTNQDLSRLARSTLRAIAPTANEVISEIHLLHWTALLIDEAAQATEPEALIPLTVVAPPLEAQIENQGLSSLPQVIMAGDEHQLGPRICSGNSSAFSTSLLARLFSRVVYSQHPLSRQMGSKRLTASMLPMKRPAFTNLIRNYRSHPAILSVPSQLFYSDTLIPECAKISETMRTWPGWKSPQSWPVLFVENTSADSVESILSGNGTGAGALFNHGEVLNAFRLVQGLLGHRMPNYEATEQIMQKEIAVMSPFKTQISLLRKLFREKGLYEVNIGPLEAFQGLESRIIVLCTTRTRRGGEEGNAARFVREDRERGLGVIGEPKRFNVAISRAKEGLIVIGDPGTLTVEGDPCWEAFISFCARNGCVMPESKEGSLDLSWVEKFAKKAGAKEGRLERALIFAADAKSREACRKEQRGFGFPETPNARGQKRFSLKGQMLTSDEEMWKTGLQMAEEMDEPTPLADSAAESRAGNGMEEDPDPWNGSRYAASKNGDLIGQENETLGPARKLPLIPAVVGEEDPVKDPQRVFSSASAKEFDRDPKAEFERTDCATQ